MSRLGGRAALDQRAPRWAVLDTRLKNFTWYDTEKGAEAHILRAGDDTEHLIIIDLEGVDLEQV